MRAAMSVTLKSLTRPPPEDLVELYSIYLPHKFQSLLTLLRNFSLLKARYGSHQREKIFRTVEDGRRRYLLPCYLRELQDTQVNTWLRFRPEVKRGRRPVRC
jgi:hypothetical protein